jgi:hypothetical protein
MICVDLIPIIHQYSTINTRIMLQRIFKNSVTFTYKKLNSNFRINFEKIDYDHQYHNNYSRHTWFIFIPLANICIYYQLEANKDEFFGSMFMNNKGEFIGLLRFDKLGAQRPANPPCNK